MKPVSKPLLYAFAYMLYSTLFYGCGSGQQTEPTRQLPGGPTAPSVIAVSLNDAFTTVTPNGSERVETTDPRYFTAPLAVNIVQGSYSGSNPGQWLHARIIVGSEQCEYQNTGINDPVLSLQFCSGGIGANTYLPANTVIELQNYDAPGYLLQADFYLSR